jgi:hypothetical protein
MHNFIQCPLHSALSAGAQIQGTIAKKKNWWNGIKQLQMDILSEQD